MTSIQSAVLILAAASLSVVNAWYCDCGKYCPDPVKKFHAPVTCPAGSYCTKSAYNATSRPTPCPAGSYCPEGACAPTDCPCGHKCPSKLPFARAPRMCVGVRRCAD